jgi:hypothetical protein
MLGEFSQRSDVGLIAARQGNGGDGTHAETPAWA